MGGGAGYFSFGGGGGGGGKVHSAQVVDLLFYVHGKHLRSCRDGQLT